MVNQGTNAHVHPDLLRLVIMFSSLYFKGLVPPKGSALGKLRGCSWWLTAFCFCVVSGKEVVLLMQALNSLTTPEEKLAALCKKYADLVSQRSDTDTPTWSNTHMTRVYFHELQSESMN